MKKVYISLLLASSILVGCTNTKLNSNKEYVLPTRTQAKAVEDFISTDIMEHGVLSLYAIDLDTNKIILDYKGKTALVPASVMKVVTGATALEVLGENKRFETKLIYDGTITKNGVLNGNLYIEGGGDPTLGSDGIAVQREGFLKEWLESIKKAGIKSINGDIIVIDDLFGYEGIPGKWLWEDMGTGYGQATYGISIFDNLYTLYLNSGAAGTTPKIIRTVPEIDGLSFDNVSVSSLSNKKDVSVRGIPLDNKRRVYGIVPQNLTGITVKSDIPDPGLFLGQYFAYYLRRNDIKFNGDIATARLTSKRPKNGHILAITKSPPLHEIIKVLLTRSDNHYTEHLFQTLEKVEKIDIVKYWEDKNIDIHSLTMRDGSGLSRGNTTSSQLLVEILQYMDKDNNKNNNIKFRSLFPVAGKDGTVSQFLKETSLNQKVKVKSGSMSGIQSYTGYINKDGKKYAFAIIINHWNGERSDLRKEIEKLLNNIF